MRTEQMNTELGTKARHAASGSICQSTGPKAPGCHPFPVDAPVGTLLCGRLQLVQRLCQRPLAVGRAVQRGKAVPPQSQASWASSS